MCRLDTQLDLIRVIVSMSVGGGGDIGIDDETETGCLDKETNCLICILHTISDLLFCNIGLSFYMELECMLWEKLNEL